MSDMHQGGGAKGPANNPLKKERKQRGKRGVNRVLALSIVGACVVVAAGVYLLATRVIQPPQSDATPAPDKSVTLVSRKKDDVVSVEITKPASVLTVLKKDDVYYAKEFPELTLNQSNASTLFYNAATARADELVEENAQDLSQYGLDAPASTTVVSYSDGSSETFYVGNATAAGSTYYIMRNGDPNVYIVWMNIASSFSYDITALREIKMPVLDENTIAHIVLERAGEEPIELSYDDTVGYTINGWRFKRPFDDVSGDLEAVQTLFQAMLGVDYTALEGRFDDLSPYGLDQPRARFSITDSSGAALDMNVGGTSPDGYYIYVSPADTNDVYKVSKSKLDFVDSTRLMQLVDTFASLINIAKVDEVSLEGSGQSAVISVARTAKIDENGEEKKLSNGETEYDEVFSLDGVKANTKATKTMYTALIATIIDGRIDETVPLADAPALTVTFTLNIAPHSITVEYLPYDKDHYAVRVNGSSHFYLRKEKVDEIFTTLRQYKAGELDVDE